MVPGAVLPKRASGEPASQLTSLAMKLCSEFCTFLAQCQPVDDMYGFETVVIDSTLEGSPLAESIELGDPEVDMSEREALAQSDLSVCQHKQCSLI